MQIPRVRFTIRSMMILMVLIAVVLGLAMFTYRQSRDQPDDGFINDPMHPRWRIPGTPAPEGTPTAPDTRRPIRPAGRTEGAAPGRHALRSSSRRRIPNESVRDIILPIYFLASLCGSSRTILVKQIGRARGDPRYINLFRAKSSTDKAVQRTRFAGH
jgi:hypothetical protein